jgi:hypothetical protein
MTITFRVTKILGDRPEHLPTGIAMVAPRPLYGETVVLEPAWGWAGQVIVAHEDSDAIRRNYSLDASVVQWFDRDMVLASERARLTVEYGAAALEGIRDEVFLSEWGHNTLTVAINLV